MHKNTAPYTILILSLLILISCSFLPANNPVGKSNETNTNNIANDEEKTEPTARPGKEAEPTKLVCNADEVIQHLDEITPYDEAKAYITQIYNVYRSTINIWFVDPEIDPNATEDDIRSNANLARQHAANLIQKLVTEEPCLAQMFPDGIMATVVDKQYNTWYSGNIYPSIVPVTDDPDTEDNLYVINHLMEAYIRTEPINPAYQPGENSCTLQDMKKDFVDQFGSDIPNNFLIISTDEEYGLKVSAQYQISDEIMAYADSSQMELDYNVALSGVENSANILPIISCMDSQPTSLFTTGVTPEGEMLYFSWLPGDGKEPLSIDDLIVLYPMENSTEGVNVFGFYCTFSIMTNLILDEDVSSCYTIEDYFHNWAGDSFDQQNFRDSEWVVDVINDYFAENNYLIKAEARGVLSKDEAIKDMRTAGIYDLATVQVPYLYHIVLLVGTDDNEEYIFYDQLFPPEDDLTGEAAFMENYDVDFNDVWVETITLRALE